MTEKYNLTMRLIHWLMALMFIGIIASGWYMEGLPSDDPNKYSLYPWHKSFGFTFLMLVVVRILVRFTSKKPALPAKLASWEQLLTKVGHFLLYVLMLMVPISGIIFSDTGGHPINFFFTEFDFFETNKELSSKAHGAHGILPYVLLGVVVLHIAGALKHRFIDKDPEVDVLKRML